MRKKVWIFSFILMIIAIIAIGIYYFMPETEMAPPKMKVPAVFKSHLIMYAISEANIYAGRGETFEIVKKIRPDELIYVDQPQGGWFPVFPSLVDSIKNLEKNRIGYIHGDHLISTSTLMRQSFAKNLKNKFTSEDKNVNISLQNFDTLIILTHSSFDENWVKKFIRSETFRDMQNLGFSDLIITSGSGFERRWKFD